MVTSAESTAQPLRCSVCGAILSYCFVVLATGEVLCTDCAYKKLDTAGAANQRSWS